MTTHESIQLFISINLIVIGLSHFFRPLIWIEFFKTLSSKVHTGNVINAMLALGIGSFVLSMHFVWTWPGIVVTLYGAALCCKGFLYLCFPQLGIKSIQLNEKKADTMRYVGLVIFLLGLFILIFVMKIN